ncbi:MAG: two-component regulator propeller domain-containing protein [Salinivirgaceae bacterium]
MVYFRAFLILLLLPAFAVYAAGASPIQKTQTDSLVTVIKVTPSQIKTYTPAKKTEMLIADTVLNNTGLISEQLATPKKIAHTQSSHPITFDTLLYAPGWQKADSLIKPAKYPTATKAEAPRYKDQSIADIKYLDVDQGLNSSYVFMSITDKNDMLWMGTYNGGLVRYDGRSFLTFTKEHGMPENSVRSIFADNENRLWIGTPGSGVVLFDGRNIIRLPDIPTLRNLYTYQFEQDDEGNLWLATRKSGIIKITANGIYQCTQASGLPENGVLSIKAEPTGKIWLGMTNHLSSLENGLITNYTFPEIEKIEVKSIYADNTNLLLFGTKENLLLKKEKEFFKIISTNSLAFRQTKSIVKDSTGHIWIATQWDELFKIKITPFDTVFGNYTNYTTEYGLSHSQISHLQAANDIVWASTYGAGINKINSNSFEHLTTEQGIPSELVWAFAEDAQKNLWLGTEKEGINEFSKNTFNRYIDSLPSHIILAGASDSKGNIWFGSYKGGVYKLAGNTITKIELIPGKTRLSIISILEDSKGNMWFGSWDDGLFRYDGTQVHHYENQVGLGKSGIADIMEDRNGYIWLSTEGDGVVKFANDTFTFYNLSNFIQSNETVTIEEIADGTIWAGTYGEGILIWDDESWIQIDERDGLSSNIVTSIIQDKTGIIWVGTDYGLNKITYTPSETPFDRSKNLSIEVFDKTRGLKGMDFFDNAVFIDSKNQIWWGTGKALTKFDLSTTSSTPAPPQISIEAVQINQQTIDFHNFDTIRKQLTQISPIWSTVTASEPIPFTNAPKQINLPYKLRHLTFHYSARDWRNPQKINYYTRLTPLEENWSKASHEVKAEYKNISPGEYTFEVYAETFDGLKSRIVTQEITVYPPWWLTTWAYLLYAIGLLFVIGFLHRQRTKTLKRRQKELENIVRQRTSEISEKNEELSTLIGQVTNQRNTVVKQRNELKHINKAVSESIDYAQRIQASLLPDKENLKTLFPESFLLFKPRDIVSGDFYWWSRVNNKLVVIAADCTGHGIPGAFMSILGISFLREIITKEKIIAPAMILEKLRSEIIYALKQQNKPGIQRDGMDMTVLVFDFERNRASYAGAHNSIYHYRDNELTEIKGDRLPIAIYPKMKPFTEKTIEFVPGDRFYMFSDGYQDQFGGKKGKKITKRTFQALITDTAELPMSQQKEKLKTFFEKWKAHQEQIDDVLVMGLQIK